MVAVTQAAQGRVLRKLGNGTCALALQRICYHRHVRCLALAQLLPPSQEAQLLT